MTRDRLRSSPRVARLILIVGAIVHFALCIPLYGRRGFPEVDPFWLAMIWLWLPPVFISAVYSRWSRKRAIDLALYALAAGFVVSWGTVDVRPSNKGPASAFRDLVLYWPVLAVCVAIVEALSRRFLAWVRIFAREPAGMYCESCGYCLYGLTEPRCRECGTPFAAEWLKSSQRDRSQTARVRAEAAGVLSRSSTGFDRNSFARWIEISQGLTCSQREERIAVVLHPHDVRILWRRKPGGKWNSLEVYAG